MIIVNKSELQWQQNTLKVQLKTMYQVSNEYDAN